MTYHLFQVNALISIHDVMPETLDSVDHILTHLKPIPNEKITLLVVPGRAWTNTQIDSLRGWQKAGYILAGHGWLHRSPPPKTVYHRLHSWLVSRNVAEHLSQSEVQVTRIIDRCHGWFSDHGLTVSSLYVPPAWALGCWSKSCWQQIPFSRIEKMRCVFSKEKIKPCYLLGFEADSLLRALFLKMFNPINIILSKLTGRPLRIAIHPYDLQFCLSRQISSLPSKAYTWINYDDLFLRY